MEEPRLEASPSDRELSRFMAANGSMIADIKRKLRTRDYENLSARSIKNFLEAAACAMDHYDRTTDLPTKTVFLKALVRAWEIADATNRFNTANLGGNYKDIRRFSRQRYDEVLSCSSNPDREKKNYYREVARSALIEIAEACRTPDIRSCRERLTELIRFVLTSLRDIDNYPCDGSLAQFYYYLSKVERTEGDLFRSEKSIAQATQLYLRKARRLSEGEEGKGKPDDEREREGKGKLDDEKEREGKILEVKLRAGVVEVARAWLYFSQRRYDAAKHAARMALIILSESGDWLSRANARLVVAAVDRVTADRIEELNKAVIDLEDLRTLFQRRRHFRLQARTEHELVLALVVLDGMIEGAAVIPDNVKSHDPLARAEEILEQAPHTQRKTGRWAALFYAQSSRVLRRRAGRSLPVDRDFSKALTAANDGLETATRTEVGSARIETLIARGEVLFQQGVASHLAKQATEEKIRSGRQPTNARAGMNQSRYVSFPLFTAPEQSSKKIDLTNPKQCFDEAREDFTQALKGLLQQSSQGGYAELAAICHLYLARIAIRSSQFGLEEFSDAAYQLYEFQRLGQFEHAWLRRLEARVRAEYERKDDWALVLTSMVYDDAEIELKQYLIKKLTRANPKMSKSRIAAMLGKDPQTVSNWEKEILNYRQEKRRKSGDA